MKNISLILITYILFSSGCEKDKYDAPLCISDRIDEFKKSVICERGSYVALYEFKGDDVYLFAEGTCQPDLGAAVYSKNCLSLGFLGGISGNTYIDGVNFYNNAKYIKRLWEN